MENQERITGETRVKVFRDLEKNKTVLTMTVIGRQFERLTIVTGLRKDNGIPFFLVDYPNGLAEAVPDADGSRVFFEYTGVDKVPYSFRSVIERITAEDLWIRFPDHIKRAQRRRHFRIETPVGTRLFFTANGKPYQTSVVNVSLGGILMFSQDRSFDRNTLFQVGDYLRSLSIVCDEGKVTRVHVKKAEIRRIEKNPIKGSNYYGIQFLEMEQEEERALDRLIYDRQREILKKRSFLVQE
jgi:c-di-GMP-binding flagellar brake protein YcgR